MTIRTRRAPAISKTQTSEMQRTDAVATIDADVQARAAETQSVKAEIDQLVPEAKRLRREADECDSRLAGLKNKAIGLGFESGKSSQAKVFLRDGAEPVIAPWRRAAHQLQEQARTAFGSSEVLERWPDGERKRTNDGRNAPIHVTNGSTINDYLTRVKTALVQLDALVYSPLSLAEIEVQAGRIVDAIGPMNNPAPPVLVKYECGHEGVVPKSEAESQHNLCGACSNAAAARRSER